jgi:hypothetical protein
VEPVQNGDALPAFGLDEGGRSRAASGLRGWMRREPRVELLRRAGLDYRELKRARSRLRFRAVPVTGRYALRGLHDIGSR